MTTALAHDRPAVVRLGLRENAAQFALLVVVNAFVGAMNGNGAQHSDYCLTEVN